MRSAGRCSPACGTPADTPGHLWILGDRRHAQSLEVRTEEGEGGGVQEEGEGEARKEDESSHTKMTKDFSRAHTHRRARKTDTHEWKQMEQKQGHGKKPERGKDGIGGGMMLDYLPSEESDSLKDCSFGSSCKWKKRERQNT